MKGIYERLYSCLAPDAIESSALRQISGVYLALIEPAIVSSLSLPDGVNVAMISADHFKISPQYGQRHENSMALSLGSLSAKRRGLATQLLFAKRVVEIAPSRSFSLQSEKIDEAFSTFS